MPLTVKQCEQAPITGKPYFLFDGDGLMLRVSEKGAKSWILRYRFDGKRRDMGLGKFGRYSLAEAREKARKLHRDIDDGIDVVDVSGPRARRKARIEQRLVQQQQAAEEAKQRKSFRECAEEFLRSTEAARSFQTQQTWHQSLRDFVYPEIGDAAVSTIVTDNVLACIEPQWQTKTVTMEKVRGRIELVLDFATAKGYRTGDNPARRELISKILPPVASLTKVEHHPALPYAEMSVFMAELRASSDPAAKALEFLILTAGVRTKPYVKARWSEIDLAARVWTVPADHMKMDRDHLVPLSDAAMALLRVLPRDGELMFPGLGEKGMYKLLKALRPDKTVHGFRATFRTWAQEATEPEIPRETAEHCLAHIEGSTSEQAYARGDAINKRRVVMERWAAFCAGAERIAA